MVKVLPLPITVANSAFKKPAAISAAGFFVTNFLVGFQAMSFAAGGPGGETGIATVMLEHNADVHALSQG